MLGGFRTWERVIKVNCVGGIPLSETIERLAKRSEQAGLGTERH